MSSALRIYEALGLKAVLVVEPEREHAMAAVRFMHGGCQSLARSR
jgi:hypothetical protein